MRSALALALAFLALLPSTNASLAPLESDTACGAPPCGFIVPTISLEFPDKQDCPGFDAIVLAECMPMLAVGESRDIRGRITWGWDATQDGIYPNDPAIPIVVSFSGGSTNPAGFSLSVSPATLTLNTQDLVDPTRYVAVQDSPTHVRLLYVYAADITLTITRTGDPTADDLRLVEGTGGVLRVFLKATSNASSDRVRAGFGTEEFRFDGSALLTTSDHKDSPAPCGILLLGLLATCGMLQKARRRRAS